MGRPKLILPVAGRPLIARVVAALRDGGAGPVVVVAPPEAEPGAPALVEVARAAGAEVVVLDAPTPDMRATVEAGLAHLGTLAEAEGFLLAPGDSPGITPATVALVVKAAAAHPGRVVVPVHGGRRGHPTLLPGALVAAIGALPDGLGINAAIAGLPEGVVEVEVGEPGVLEDLDTPEDYRRWSPPGG